MQAIEQRQPTSQKNQVGFDKKDKNISNECLIEGNPYKKGGGKLPPFWFRKAVRTSVKEIKDQNKNEKNIDKERKNVLQ